MRGIDRLQEQGVGIGLISVITKKNMMNLIDLLELCKEKGIRAISFLPYFPSGYGAHKEDELKTNNDIYWGQTRKVIDWLVNHNYNHPSSMIYERELASIVKNILIPGNGCYMCASSPCGAGTQHVGLDVDGDIYVCDTFYGLSDYVIGNIGEECLDDILKNPLIEKFTHHSVHTVPKCSKCHINSYCYGGCVAHNVSFYGEDGWNRESHLCSWFMKTIPYLKEQFDKQRIDPTLLSELPDKLAFNKLV